MTQTDDVLLVDDDAHVRTLRLNRPDRANALNSRLLERLTDEIVRAENDRDVWTVIITGTGGTFCAGGDLKEMAATDTDRTEPVRPSVGATSSVFEIMTRMETPVIAALNGHAVAGGFELALAADIRIGSSEARYGLPEAKRGMGAAFGTVLLPRLVPPGIAAEMLFTGRLIEAEEAARLGLLNHTVAPEDVLPRAEELAQEITQNAPVTVRRMKANLQATSGQPLLSALHLDVGPDPYTSEDRVEGVRAFVEKRQPEWRNR